MPITFKTDDFDNPIEIKGFVHICHGDGIKSGISSSKLDFIITDYFKNKVEYVASSSIED